MPSVRVKRGQYASLSDDPQGNPWNHRPRSRTFAGNRTAAPPDVEPAHNTDEPHHYHYRRRSRTVNAREAPSSPPGSPPQRPPSRITEHIMGVARTPQLGEPTRRHGDDRLQDVMYSPPVGRSGDGRDTVSIRGPREDIVYRGHATMPGRIGSALSLPYSEGSVYDDEGILHHDDIVEHLDVIDPQVATVSTLADTANTIVFPPLSFYSRKPVIVLPDIPERSPISDAEKGEVYEDNLDRHVQDVLRKRDKFRRIMKGVWAFMKTPMGIIFSIYGFLVVFWGTGIVVFLIKIINLHNHETQAFWVELCQQVETGLFTATSIGLIPFRALDTWRICWIWHYQRTTIKRRQKAGLPALYDNNDLPDPYYDRNYVKVLTDKEQEDLHYQQHKFMRSMTWYRPHGTFTHRAFPVSTALWICLMNDLNSFFQILLSACMWSMDRIERPAWTTGTTLPAAFVAGILAGVFIWRGSKKSRRHKEVEARLRAALAMDPAKASSAATSSTLQVPEIGKPVMAGTSSTLQIPELPMKGKVSNSEPSTTDTTPTLNPFGTPPDAKDKVEDNDTPDQKGKGVERHWYEVNDSGHDVGMQWDVIRRREPPPPNAQRTSANSVPISDTMTVPPASMIYPPSVPRR